MFAATRKPTLLACICIYCTSEQTSSKHHTNIFLNRP